MRRHVRGRTHCFASAELLRARVNESPHFRFHPHMVCPWCALFPLRLDYFLLLHQAIDCTRRRGIPFCSSRRQEALIKIVNIDPWILAFSALTVIATIGMGFWSARRSKTAHDFFVAGRSVSVGWNASAISGEYLSAASFMGV